MRIVFSRSLCMFQPLIQFSRLFCNGFNIEVYFLQQCVQFALSAAFAWKLVSIWECVLHLEHLIDATRHSLSLIKWTKMFTQQMLNSLVENVLNYFTDNFSETSFYLNFWSLLPPTKANFFSTTRMNLNTHCRCLPLSQCNGSVSVSVSGFGWNELTYAPHQIW